MSRPPLEALAGALERNDVLIVCGAGGVGKTTTAAALGLQAALDGRRVLVCTIDPSRRLATSLGLDRLRDKPREMDLARAGAGPAKGSLWAMMLDTKRTFDQLVINHAPSEAAKARILNNRFYQQVSAALAGSHEYMAMEKLLELTADGRFDLVILDTPPTRHALDFLEAPDRMTRVLDTSVLRWMLKPYFAAGRLALKVTTRTGAVALKLADNVLGLQFLQDLSEFFLAFEGMYEGFKERAARVHDLLRGEGSGFVVVASPAALTLDEALYFHARLREGGMPFVAFVVNRVHPDPAEGHPPARGAADLDDDDLAAELVEIFQDQRRLAKADRRSVARLEADSREGAIAVPEFEADVHDLRGLRDVAEAIFGGGRGPDGRGTGRRRRRERAPSRGALRTYSG
jgi:anion-transporting  ArsA/GET3 family ATPase